MSAVAYTALLMWFCVRGVRAYGKMERVHRMSRHAFRLKHKSALVLSAVAYTALFMCSKIMRR